jgi:hypothetical protein
MSNRRSPTDAETRNAASALAAWFGKSREVEALAKRRGLAVSHATFSRAVGTHWYEPGPHRPGLIDLFVRTFAEELAFDRGHTAPNESDVLDVHQWVELNRMDSRLRAPSPTLWRQDADLAREILAQPHTDTLSNQLVRSSALLHLSRNPMLAPHEREQALADAIELLEQAIAEHASIYTSTTFEDLLVANRDDLVSMLATDPTGIVISTMLHLVNQAYAARGDAAWRQNMTDLLQQGLVPQMAVRGMFFTEPETVINTAELLFETGDSHNARRLMIRAKEMDMNLLERIEALWAARLEPGFMAFVRATLTPHTAKVLLVATTAMAAMFGLSPVVALAKPIIVSGM